MHINHSWICPLSFFVSFDSRWLFCSPSYLKIIIKKIVWLRICLVMVWWNGIEWWKEWNWHIMGMESGRVVALCIPWLFWLWAVDMYKWNELCVHFFILYQDTSLKKFVNFFKGFMKKNLIILGNLLIKS